MRAPVVSCVACGGLSVRRSKRQSIAELGNMLLGAYPFRCLDCGARFWASVWLLSKLPFAKCPKCLSVELITWPERHFAPGFRKQLLMMFGAQRYRCQPCRYNFLSFRPRRTAVPNSESGELIQSGHGENTVPTE